MQEIADSFGIPVGALVSIWVFSGLLGAMIGSGKGKAGQGFLLGLLLGVIGLIIIAVISPTPEAQAHRNAQVASAGAALTGASPTRPCPWCAEPIKPQAVVCKHCGREVESIVLEALPTGTAEGWYQDPATRHPDRYWDGDEWTKWVRDKPGGTRSEDPPLKSL